MIKTMPCPTSAFFTLPWRGRVAAEGGGVGVVRFRKESAPTLTLPPLRGGGMTESAGEG
jgi:hypothetical protein